jgi:hypothetical protein
MLTVDSGISTLVLEQRGYWTATTADELTALGFADYQRRTPCLVLPVHDVHGNIALHQIRPDQPRKNKRGKRLKYDTPAGSHITLDIHPTCRATVDQADVPLMIVEGLRKADSVSSRISPEQPLCVVGLVGVWGWKRNGKPLPDWNRIVLKDRRVIVCYDSDAGTVREVSQAREALVTFLTSQGANVKQVELPPLAAGKCGADDFLVAGHSLDDLLRLAQDYTPPQPAHALLIQADTIQEESINYLWFPCLPRKMASLLDGDPGVGKTGLACLIAASVTRGWAMPDQTGKPTLAPDGPGAVLMVALEDNLGAVIIPRLKQCGADLSRIAFVNECVGDDGNPRPFTLADLPLLADYMERVRPRFVYIDAIQSVLGAKADINRANQVTALLAPLKKLAEQYDCAVLCSRHPAKPGQNTAKVLYRGMGSQAFVGTVRYGLFIEEHPSDSSKSLLVHYKANGSALGRTIIFSKAQGKFEWAGVSRITHRALAGDGSPGPLPQQKLKAALWLEAKLDTAKGMGLPASALLKEADEIYDFSNKVLRAAAECLGVTKSQVLGDFLWSLPPLSLSPLKTGTSGETGGTGGTGGTGVDWPLQGETDFSPATEPPDTDPPDPPDTQDTPVPPVLTGDEGAGERDMCAVNNSLPYEDEDWADILAHLPPWITVAGTTDETLGDPRDRGAASPVPASPLPSCPDPCHICRGIVFWVNAGGQLICQRCHPNPDDRLTSNGHNGAHAAPSSTGKDTP